MEKRRRIALYGGTFDPVHVGHMAVARSLLSLFALDEVLFIPAYVAPHKRERRVSPALDRYAMLALATQGEARFRVSAVEMEAPERPYTVDRKSTRLNSSHSQISYAVFCLKKKKTDKHIVLYDDHLVPPYLVLHVAQGDYVETAVFAYLDPHLLISRYLHLVHVP